MTQDPTKSPAVSEREARSTIRDALLDSLYLAGLKAGWNAAQADDPEKVFAEMLRSLDGHLAGYADAKEVLARLAPAPEKVVREAADDLANRQKVNTILGSVLAPLIPDMVQLIEIGNRTCTRILLALAQPEAARVSGLREAALGVLRHRVGELPSRGWLRDNDASRQALDRLSVALDKHDAVLATQPAAGSEG